MEADEQRIALRKPVVLKVRFRASTVEEFAERYSRDLSEGGMFVRSPGPLPQPGTVLLLECRLSDGALLINGAATVAWVRAQPSEEGPSGFGMRFDDLSPESRAVLEMILETSASTHTPPRAPVAGAVLSAAPVPQSSTAPAVGATRFPTLIGELPTINPGKPSPRDPAPAAPEARPPRPAWFHSHEFDDEDEPSANEPPEALSSEPTSASAPGVPSWFRSTGLLQGTPAPPSEPEPEPSPTAAPKAPSVPPGPPAEASNRPPTPPASEAPAPISSVLHAPERPRKTEPLSAVPGDVPIHLPRPTPAVVAAPHEVPLEPFPASGTGGRARRHWMAAILLTAAGLVAFGLGYVFMEYAFPDKSAELLRELEQRQAHSDPPAVSVPPPAAKPEPAPPPTVVIPHAPAPAAAVAPSPTPEPVPRAVPARRRPSPKSGTAVKPPPSDEEPPRRSKSGANSDFQKRLRELERMLKRK